MTVTVDTVRGIAALARLRLEDGEAERLAHDLSDVLGHIDALAGADVSGVEGTWGVTEGPAPLRPGRYGALDPLAVPADALAEPPSAFAPEFRDGFFVVPRLEAMEGGA